MLQTPTVLASPTALSAYQPQRPPSLASPAAGDVYGDALGGDDTGPRPRRTPAFIRSLPLVPPEAL